MELSLRIPILRIRLRFSFWFFAVAALFFLLDRRVILWYVALPVLLHESGHLLAMLLCGVGVKEIYFTPVSIRVLSAAKQSLSYGREVFVASAGIAANLLAALALHLFFFHSMRNMMLIASNLAVACFNLLPISTLDGGQIARLFCQRTVGPVAAQRLSQITSAAVLLPLTVAAVALTLRGVVNFTAPALCLYLVTTILLRSE